MKVERYNVNSTTQPRIVSPLPVLPVGSPGRIMTNRYTGKYYIGPVPQPPVVPQPPLEPLPPVVHNPIPTTPTTPTPTSRTTTISYMDGWVYVYQVRRSGNKRRMLFHEWTIVHQVKPRGSKYRRTNRFRKRVH